MNRASLEASLERNAMFAIAEDVEKNADSHAASSVRYNRDLGYPEVIYVDPTEHPDDELGREMSNLEPLSVK